MCQEPAHPKPVQPAAVVPSAAHCMADGAPQGQAKPAGPEPVCQTQMTRPMMPSPTIVITVSGLTPIDSPHGSRREALSNRSRDAANPNRIRDTQCQLGPANHDKGVRLEVWLSGWVHFGVAVRE